MSTSNKNSNIQSSENITKPFVWFMGGIVFAMILFIAIGVLILILSKPGDSHSGNTSLSTFFAPNSNKDGIDSSASTDNNFTGSDNEMLDNKGETTVGSESTVDNNITVDSDSTSSSDNTNNSDDSNSISSDSSTDDSDSNEEKDAVVWVTESGSKYHSKPSCSGMKSPQEITLEEAEKEGYEPCKRCQ